MYVGLYMMRLSLGLKRHGVSADQIQYAVCTHGHSDHIGNLNLFTKAIHIVSYDLCEGDLYIQHDFQKVFC